MDSSCEGVASVVHLDRSVVMVLFLHVMATATAVLDELLLLPAVVEDRDGNNAPEQLEDQANDHANDDPCLDNVHASLIVLKGRSGSVAEFRLVPIGRQVDDIGDDESGEAGDVQQGVAVEEDLADFRVTRLDCYHHEEQDHDHHDGELDPLSQPSKGNEWEQLENADHKCPCGQRAAAAAALKVVFVNAHSLKLIISNFSNISHT